LNGGLKVLETDRFAGSRADGKEIYSATLVLKAILMNAPD